MAVKWLCTVLPHCMGVDVAKGGMIRTPFYLTDPEVPEWVINSHCIWFWFSHFWFTSPSLARSLLFPTFPTENSPPWDLRKDENVVLKVAGGSPFSVGGRNPCTDDPLHSGILG